MPELSANIQPIQGHDGKVSGIGDFIFKNNVASVSNETAMYLNTTDGEAEEIKAQLVLDPSNGRSTLRARSFTRIDTFDNTDWMNATWAPDGSGGSTLRIINAPGLVNFISNFFSNTSPDSRRIFVNDREGIFDYCDGSNSDITIFLKNLAPTENSTVTKLQVNYSHESSVDIDYDGGDFNIKAGDMSLCLSSDDDVRINSNRDSVVLAARHDIVLNAGDNPQRRWIFSSDGIIYGQQGMIPTKTVVPAAASDPGIVGQIAWNTDYFYVCVAPDTWKRIALSTWQ